MDLQGPVPEVALRLTPAVYGLTSTTRHEAGRVAIPMPVRAEGLTQAFS
jgi:hypothetical protein